MIMLEWPSFIRHRFNKIVNLFITSSYYKPHNLPKSIEVKWEYDKKHKTYYAEVLSLPGIFTTSSSAEKLINNVNSLLYRHFEIPDHIAQKEMELGLRYVPPMDLINSIRKQGGSVRINLKRLAYN